MSRGKSVTHSVGPLYLGPEMNPLRMILEVNRRGKGSSTGIKRLEYTLVLAGENGRPAWEKSGSRQESGEEESDSSRIRLSLGAFEIQQG